MRWNLKEAAGKALARRTETASEAAMLDEKANILKVRYLYGKRGRICGGQKREGGCALPGRSADRPMFCRRREATGWVGGT